MRERSRSAVTTTVPAVPSPPRWAKIAAHIAALLPLPSGIWRLTLVAGCPAGYTADGLVELDLSGVGRVYLVVLVLLIEAAALLTLGLVSRWGERMPRWMPRWGGRKMRPRIIVFLASIGAAILLALWTPFLAWWSISHPELTNLGSTLIGLLYLPLVAWAPLLIAVTIDYHRRHTRTRRNTADRDTNDPQ